MEIRKTAPAVNNKYYVKTTYGGYNKCILINKDTGSVLPNCVGYAYGRFMECANIQSCNLPTTDAKEWFKTAPYLKGQQAKQGAIACWNGGEHGHVAFVEEVYANGSILTSQSNYGGVRWESKVMTPPYDKFGLHFQGFIYNPYLEDSQSNIKMKGCDVSQWQNPNEVDVSKYDFAIIRATWGTNLDEQAEQWAIKLNRLGIPFGVYCYSYALDDEGAMSEADFLYKILKQWHEQLNIGVELGVWYDMEPDAYKTQNGFTTPDQWTSACNVFCQRMQDYGFYVGIYASESYFDSHIHTTKWDRWVASWGTNDGTIQRDTSSMGTLLQYTSHGGLDKDVSYCELEHYKSYPVFSTQEPIEDDSSSDDKDTEPSHDGSDSHHIEPIPMPDDDYLFKMSDKVYDFLNWLIHIIPLGITLYIALSNIWGWKMTEPIVATISAIEVFLSSIVKQASIGYQSKKGKK